MAAQATVPVAPRYRSNLIDVVTSVPGIWVLLAASHTRLRAVSRAFRDLHDATWTKFSIDAPSLRRIYATVEVASEERAALCAVKAIAARGCRPTELHVISFSTLPRHLALEVLLSVNLASVTCLILRDSIMHLTASQAISLSAALPALARVRLEVAPAVTATHCQARQAQSAQHKQQRPSAPEKQQGELQRVPGQCRRERSQTHTPQEPDASGQQHQCQLQQQRPSLRPGAIGSEDPDVPKAYDGDDRTVVGGGAGFPVLLRAVGPRLASLDVSIPLHLQTWPHQPRARQRQRQWQQPALVLELLLEAASSCAALRALQLQLSQEVVTEDDGGSGQAALEGSGWEPPTEHRNGREPDMPAAVISALAALTGLVSLELRGLSALPVHNPLGAVLAPLRGLTRLTSLTLPLTPAGAAANPASTDAATANGGGNGDGDSGGYGNLDGAGAPRTQAAPLPPPPPAPKRWHVECGAAVQRLLLSSASPLISPSLGLPLQAPPTSPDHPRPQPRPPPPLFAEQLVDLDLGHDLALTLPYLPYSATALTRLAVGELSAECVPASQWDLVPEPPPALPYDLLSGVPTWALERPLVARSVAAGDVGGGGGSTGGGAGGSGTGAGGSDTRPLCSLPVAAVRLPQRLRELKVRYMPDAAVLAALAALPDFRVLDCTAVRHPQGEICLDLAAVGLPGPPDLTFALPLLRRPTSYRDSTSGIRASGDSSSSHRSDPYRYGSATGDGSVRPVLGWVTEMVHAAAGLLLRALSDEDWRRHPLSLRPSPFSFLRDSYDRLRWPGPHAAWMGALERLAPKVSRVRLKNMRLQVRDVPALAGALTGLQSLELVRCSAQPSHLRFWQQRVLGGEVALDVALPDQPPGGPEDCVDMFVSSSSSGGGSRSNSEG